jgi:hypothetical protein
MNEICKLTLNSLYGKTIIKPYTTKTVIKDNSKVEDYIMQNFELLISQEECGNQSIMTLCMDELGHSNMAHIGGMILSMARRIMNEVMAIANDLNVHILYQDTDAVLVLDAIDTIDNYKSKFTTLEEAYKIKYGKDLVGDQLGQFDNEFKYPGHENIHSTHCIILGKKCYINLVTGKNFETGEYESYPCPKMSGVNSYAMNEYSDYFKLYKRLYNGDTIEFDLAYGDSVVFDFKNDMVTTRDSFIKHVSFKGEKYEL